MKYTIYKITNMINNKIYIGCHKTLDLDDGYMGSGKILKYAINKYGEENFVKEYLNIFDNAEDMFNMEATLVNEEFVADKDTYNLKEGGKGGFDHINSQPDEYHESKVAAGKRTYAIHGCANLTKAGIPHRKKKGDNKGVRPDCTFAGRKHSEETKKQIGLTNSKYTGDKNSQFGTMWITNGVISKKISKTDSIPEGFRKGRKIKVDKH